MKDMKYKKSCRGGATNSVPLILCISAGLEISLRLINKNGTEKDAEFNKHSRSVAMPEYEYWQTNEVGRHLL